MEEHVTGGLEFSAYTIVQRSGANLNLNL